MSKSSSWLRGLSSEELVRAHYESLGYECLGQRIKITHTEIDLIFKTPKGILLVEVKSLGQYGHREFRFSKTQIRRIKNAFLTMSLCHDHVEFHLAFVTHNDKIEVIEDFLRNHS